MQDAAAAMTTLPPYHDLIGMEARSSAMVGAPETFRSDSRPTH